MHEANALLAFSLAAAPFPPSAYSQVVRSARKCELVTLVVCSCLRCRLRDGRRLQKGSPPGLRPHPACLGGDPSRFFPRRAARTHASRSTTRRETVTTPRDVRSSRRPATQADSGGGFSGNPNGVEQQLAGSWRCKYCGEGVAVIQPDRSPRATILARPAGAGTRVLEINHMLLHRCAMQSAWISKWTDALSFEYDIDEPGRTAISSPVRGRTRVGTARRRKPLRGPREATRSKRSNGRRTRA
jgi:hypothetical protein